MPDKNVELRRRLNELAAKYPAYGQPMLHDIIRKEWSEPINRKRTERIYREEGLSMRLRKKKRRRLRHLRDPKPEALRPCDVWSMDFVHDWLATNQRLKVLTIIDHCTRELPAIHAGISIKGGHVVEVLERLGSEGKKPKVLIVDNGPEFRSRALQAWATKNEVRLHFIDPGKPVQNAFIESLNGRLRAECLDQNLFENLDLATLVIAAWKKQYENERPHSSLGGLTPKEFRQKLDRAA